MLVGDKNKVTYINDPQTTALVGLSVGIMICVLINYSAFSKTIYFTLQMVGFWSFNFHKIPAFGKVQHEPQNGVFWTPIVDKNSTAATLLFNTTGY